MGRHKNVNKPDGHYEPDSQDDYDESGWKEDDYKKEAVKRFWFRKNRDRENEKET